MSVSSSPLLINNLSMGEDFSRHTHFPIGPPTLINAPEGISFSLSFGEGRKLAGYGVGVAW